MDVTHLIERLEVFEERASVRLEALSAEHEDVNRWYGRRALWLCGELHSTQSDLLLAGGVGICVIVYDPQGRVCGHAVDVIEPQGFYAFQPFKIGAYCVDGVQASKVRLIIMKTGA